jgi:hypothetical protein
MEHSPSWEANSPSLSQEIPSILWNPEDSLPCSQEPITGPYPEPDESSPHLPSVLFPSGFPTKILYALSVIPKYILVQVASSNRQRRLVAATDASERLALDCRTGSFSQPDDDHKTR